jgi:hypothetical protein
MIEEEAETSVAELLAVALQIVAAELVNHNNHDQFGMGVVGGGKTGRGQIEGEDKEQSGVE